MRFQKGFTTLVTLMACLSACAALPPVPTTGASSRPSVTAGFGVRVRTANVTITPLSLVEDSRCPTNVQCIQAGTARILVKLVRRSEASEVTVGLEAPYKLGNDWLHLVAACPYPRHPVTPAPSAYRFTFLIDQRPSAPDYRGSCA